MHAQPTCSQRTDSQQEVSVSMLVKLEELEREEKQALKLDSGDSTRIGSPIARGLRSPIARADSQVVLRIWNETAPTQACG